MIFPFSESLENFWQSEPYTSIIEQKLANVVSIEFCKEISKKSTCKNSNHTEIMKDEENINKNMPKAYFQKHVLNSCLRTALTFSLKKEALK